MTTPGELTFSINRELLAPGVVVSDEEVREAIRFAFRHLKLVVEPGGAVALAAALFHPQEIEGNAVVVVLSGGNADPGVFRTALEKHG